MTDEKDIRPEDNESPDATDTVEEQSVEETTDAGDPEVKVFEELEKTQAELKDARERTLRTLADMENLRKRFAREKEDIRRRAASDLIEELLPALDNLEIGLSSAANHPEAANVAKGFEFVAAQLAQILEQQGLSKIDPAAGTEFNHDIHEAVSTETSDEVPDHHVIKVMRVGYTLNERLLRPASVVVSSGPEGA